MRRIFNRQGFAPDVEADYQADLGPEKIRVARTTAWVAVFLFTVFGLLDLWALPSDVAGVWLARASVDAVAVAMWTLATCRPAWLLRHYGTLVAGYYASFGLHVGWMMALAHPSDSAWSTYHGGLLLVSMALYAFTYLSVRPAVLAGLFVIGVYLVVAIGWHGRATALGWPHLLANVFFLVGANVIGVFTVDIRERFSRRAYLLKSALRRDVEMKDEERRRSQHLAEHDALTGLPNRVQCLRQVDQLIATARQRGGTVALMFIDLDGFKAVNDTYGHAEGDELLKRVAERVRACLRPDDLVARLGGDEFVVALPVRSGDAATIDRVAQTLVDAIGRPAGPLQVGASVGIALYPMHGDSAQALLAAADAGMYAAKRAGKGAFALAPRPPADAHA